jgi:hypothetical protein
VTLATFEYEFKQNLFGLSQIKLVPVGLGFHIELQLI